MTPVIVWSRIGGAWVVRLPGNRVGCGESYEQALNNALGGN